METLIDTGLVSKQIYTFVLVLLRVSIFMAMMPVVSSKNFPIEFKAGIVIALSVMITPMVNFSVRNDEIVHVIVKEVILAMLLGGAARLIFTAVNMGGQLISNGMSLSMASTFDPEFGQSAEISRFFGIIVSLLFVAVDAHHDMIYILVKSYDVLPPGQINVQTLMVYKLMGGIKLFVLAIKIAAPVMVGMLVVHLLLGFLYKAAPQINVMFISFPILIYVGLLIMMFSMPAFMHVLGIYIGEIKAEMLNVLLLAKGVVK